MSAWESQGEEVYQDWLRATLANTSRGPGSRKDEPELFPMVRTSPYLIGPESGRPSRFGKKPARAPAERCPAEGPITDLHIFSVHTLVEVQGVKRITRVTRLLPGRVLDPRAGLEPVDAEVGEEERFAGGVGRQQPKPGAA